MGQREKKCALVELGSFIRGDKVAIIIFKFRSSQTPHSDKISCYPVVNSVG